MQTRIAINGFGRIGRIVLKAILEKHKQHLRVIAINDLADAKTLAHLFKYDSVHGIFDGDVKAGENGLSINEEYIRILSEKDPATLPWGNLGIDVVIEATGAFNDRESAQKHLASGAKKVVIAAPAKGEDITVVLGVNHDKYNPADHHIISNGSCTTNCLAPIAMILDERFGITRGFLTTVHSYTNDQRILDLPHKDLRRSRAAFMSIIPTTTGAAKAIGLVLPHLKGKLNGLAVRVPTPTVSLTDFVAELKQSVTAEQVNGIFKQAAGNRLKGILDFSEEDLVSVDYRSNPHSSIIDASSTMVLEDNMVKILAWYDNEWGYSHRVADLVEYIIGIKTKEPVPAGTY